MTYKVRNSKGKSGSEAAEERKEAYTVWEETKVKREIRVRIFKLVMCAVIVFPPFLSVLL